MAFPIGAATGPQEASGASQDPTPAGSSAELGQDGPVVDSAARADAFARAIPPSTPFDVGAAVVVTTVDVDLRVADTVNRVVVRVGLWSQRGLDGRAPSTCEFVLPLPAGVVVRGESALAPEDGLFVTAHDSDIAISTALHRGEPARAALRALARERSAPHLPEHDGCDWLHVTVEGLPPSRRRTMAISYSVPVAMGSTDASHGGDGASSPAAGVCTTVPLTWLRHATRYARLTIRGEVRSSRPVALVHSLTHELDIVGLTRGASVEEGYAATFTCSQRPGNLDLDFELRHLLTPELGAVETLVLHERPEADADGWFVAVVGASTDPAAAPEPRDIVFVVDRSGSMQGSKLRQAQAALCELVERLRPTDRFDIVSYAASADTFAEELVSPTPDVVAQAQKHVRGLRAGGATNIESALGAALRRFAVDERVDHVVFLTDGQPTVGEKREHELATLVAAANASAARLVVFGLGFDVNTALLDRMARESRGAVEYVLPSEDIGERVPRFYARCDAPVLLDAHLEVHGVSVHDVHPVRFGDLHQGFPAIVVDRYVGAGAATLVLRGQRGGAERSYEFETVFPERTAAATDAPVARIWASRQVGALVDAARLGGSSDAIVGELVALATRFGLVTEYTRHLVDVGGMELLGDIALADAEAALAKGLDAKLGSHAFTQAKNSATFGRARAVLGSSWYDSSGQLVVIDGVRFVSGRTFFRRGDVWIEAGATSVVADERVALFSEPFFALLDRHPWLAPCVARTGELVVLVDGRSVRVGPAR